jgi:predicted aconitase with swiveling domain
VKSEKWELVAERVLVAGTAVGVALVLSEPLSLWGGLDPETGRIIDQRHPQVGEIVTEKVLVMPAGRGSSSASSILLEAIRAGTAPAAIITAEIDGILALGAAVGQEVYDRSLPVLVLSGVDYGRLATGQQISIEPNNTVWVQ